MHNEGIREKINIARTPSNIKKISEEFMTSEDVTLLCFFPMVHGHADCWGHYDRLYDSGSMAFPSWSALTPLKAYYFTKEKVRAAA